jgi:Holliday junction resolvase RusA-like endonuclease
MKEREFKTITIPGAMPCKKSKYRIGNGRMFHDSSLSDSLAAAAIVVQSQWGRAPVIHPKMSVEFHVLSGRMDRDGMLATLSDILQKAGVLKNDNIKNHNGELTILPAVKTKQPMTVVRLWW